MSLNAESEAERTLRNLCVVAQVKQNDKLITLGDTFEIYPPTVLRGVTRKWSGEGRDGNLKRLVELVNSACGYVTYAAERLRVSDDRATLAHLQRKCERVTTALGEARIGLINLAHTYADDITCKVRIGLIIQNIEDFLHIVCHESDTARLL